jgi:hypothetical protein
MQDGSFDFLGYHFERDHRWPRQKSLDKFKDTIRVKTQRTNGQKFITDLNRTSRGWFEYFKHSHRFTFTALDKWVPMGLRSLLRFPPRAGRTWPGLGPSTLAQCFLCQAGALLPNCCPCSGLSILAEVRPPTGEPDAGEPPVRFGGRGSGSSRSPYPLHANRLMSPRVLNGPPLRGGGAKAPAPVNARSLIFLLQRRHPPELS